MTTLEVTGLVAAVITAIATSWAVGYAVWRNRRSVTIPFYAELKASQDGDDNHWVQVHALIEPSLRAGKVVKLDRAVVVLDHPQVGNQPIALSAVHGVKPSHRGDEDWDSWVPSLDSDREAR